MNIAILVLSSSVFTVANANNIYRESTGSLAPDLAYRPPELTPHWQVLSTSTSSFSVLSHVSSSFPCTFPSPHLRPAGADCCGNHINIIFGVPPHTIYRALIDFFRKRALPSRVLFELGWLILFWIMHLGKSSHCRPGPNFRLTLSIPAQRVPRV